MQAIIAEIPPQGCSGGQLDASEFLVPEQPDLKGREYPIAAWLVFGAFPQEYGDDGRVEWGETALLWIELNHLPTWSALKARDQRDVTTEVALRPVHSKKDFAGLPRLEQGASVHGSLNVPVLRAPDGSTDALAQVLLQA